MSDTELLPVATSIELVNWVKTLDEDEMRNLLWFMCGYRPALMLQFKHEAEEGLR